MKRPFKGCAEQDVFTRWRRMYTYTQRAGVCADVKRRYRRQERREAKRGTRTDD